MAINKSLITGSTTMLILGLLATKDMYGYEMIATLRDRSDNVFELKAGTLYPILHNLELKGYVKSYEMVENGKTRKYYSINEKGNKFLKTQEKEWQDYTIAVNKVIGVRAFAGV